MFGLGEFFLWWVCNLLPYLFWLFLVWILFSQKLKWLHLLDTWIYFLEITFPILFQWCTFYPWGCHVFLGCNRKMDHVFKSSLLVCVFLLRVIKKQEQCSLILVILLLWCGVWLTFDSLFLEYLFLLSFGVWLAFSGWTFPSGTFWRAEKVDSYCLNLVL